MWVTFLGAIVALKEHGHLGSDMLVSRLPKNGKKICLVVGQLLMLYITWLLFKGSLDQTRINLDVEAPVTGAPLAVVYAPASCSRFPPRCSSCATCGARSPAS